MDSSEFQFGAFVQNMSSDAWHSLKKNFILCRLLFGYSALEVAEAVVKGNRDGQVDTLYCQQQAHLHEMQAAFNGILASSLLFLMILEESRS